MTAVAISRQHCGQVEAGDEFSSAAKKFRDRDAPLLQLWCELLPLRVAGNEHALRRVIENSTAVDARGTHALTSALATNAITGIAGVYRPPCGAPVDTPPPAEPSVNDDRCADKAVAITCFGSVGLYVDGQPLDLSALRPQARNVLQLLSLAPNRDHRCEFLEEGLWPGVAHSVAAHRLGSTAKARARPRALRPVRRACSPVCNNRSSSTDTDLLTSCGNSEHPDRGPLPPSSKNAVTEHQ